MVEQDDRAGQDVEGPPDESGFLIDGDRYEIPSLYSFDMDENKIMYDLSGTPTEDWLLMIEAAKAGDVTAKDVEDTARKIQNPGFLRAAVHIAYRRAHPEARHDEINVVVGKSNHIANWAALFLAGGESGDAADPTRSGSTSEPQPLSRNESDDKKPMIDSSPEKPGNSSRSDSERPDGTPAPTGTGESGTSSRRWGRIRSVA